MIFASPLFLFLFLPITLAVYFLLRVEFRNCFLLFASLLFYAWGEPVYVFLMLGSILINYSSGLLIHFFQRRSQGGGGVKVVLIASIALNLAILFYFKYTNFLVVNLNVVLEHFKVAPISHPHVFLPVGISFFTFQAMSYVVDVYRRETPAQFSLVNCALYVALFPQLIAGPIVRYHDVARQIVSRTVTRAKFASGIQRFIYGLSKKVILANPLGELADIIFAVPVHEVTTGMSWIGIVAYSLQIYFDFSGYSDMAIGLGRFFGFEFLENFNYPYISQSIREFWRCWHISLSTWFRDYVYIPLGGNRVSPVRNHVNLWVVFLLCGLWHGASWNFVVWGAFHGLCLVVERMGWHHLLSKMWRPMRHGYTLLLVVVGWVFFRAETLSHAFHYLASMFGLSHASGMNYHALLYCDPKTVLTLLAGLVFAMPVTLWIGRWVNRRGLDAGAESPGQRLACAVHYGALLVLFVLSTACLASGTYNPFIYFRF